MSDRCGCLAPGQTSRCAANSPPQAPARGEPDTGQSRGGACLLYAHGTLRFTAVRFCGQRSPVSEACAAARMGYPQCIIAACWPPSHLELAVVVCVDACAGCHHGGALALEQHEPAISEGRREGRAPCCLDVALQALDAALWCGMVWCVAWCGAWGARKHRRSYNQQTPIGGLTSSLMLPGHAQTRA